MSLEIVTGKFDALAKLAEYQSKLPVAQYGAACHFVGTMRDFNQGDKVHAMLLQYYPGMTERQLQKIIDHAYTQWDLLGLLVVHRVGQIEPGDHIVLCAAWAAHRDTSFQACRFLIEELKTRAPFWKQETLHHGKRWLTSP